jgi:hypothetical protein
MALRSSEFKEGVVTVGYRDRLSSGTPGLSSTSVSVTCAADLHVHEVREVDLAPAARGGYFPTLCGQTITAASMAEPGRRRCPRCVELRGGGTVRRPTGLLRRLVARYS